MAQLATKNITVDTAATEIFSLSGATFRDNDLKVTLQAAGTFGSGTLSYLISLDGGTNKVPVEAVVGTAYTTTTGSLVSLNLPIVGATDKIIVYAALSGATAPDIFIIPVTNQ